MENLPFLSQVSDNGVIHFHFLPSVFLTAKNLLGNGIFMKNSEQSSTTKIKILLVDDQKRVLNALRLSLSIEPDLEVVGEAVNGLEALEQVEQCWPQVVIMDIEMPVLDGLKTTRELKNRYPNTAVILISIWDDHLTEMAALAAGANAFVPKRGIGRLLESIRQVAYLPHKPGQIAITSRI